MTAVIKSSVGRRRSPDRRDGCAGIICRLHDIWRRFLADVRRPWSELPSLSTGPSPEWSSRLLLWRPLIAVALSDSYLILRKLLPHVQQRRLEGETVMIELTRTHGPLSKYHRHPSFYYINTQSSAAVLDMTGGRGIISCRNIAQGPGIRWRPPAGLHFQWIDKLVVTAIDSSPRYPPSTFFFSCSSLVYSLPPMCRRLLGAVENGVLFQPIDRFLFG